MFPFRTSSIFRSRWVALLWAGGDWTAVSLVPGSHPAADDADGANALLTDVTGSPVSEAQVRETEAMLRRLRQ